MQFEAIFDDGFLGKAKNLKRKSHNRRFRLEKFAEFAGRLWDDDAAVRVKQVWLSG